MKILRTCLFAFALIGAIAFDGVVFVKPAAAQPAFFLNTHKTRLPFDHCMRDARRTVRDVGLRVTADTGFAIGGITATAHAFIICTRLPRAGPCPGQDGAVVTLTSASFPGPDAKAMLDRMVSAFGDGILFDCG